MSCRRAPEFDHHAPLGHVPVLALLEYCSPECLERQQRREQAWRDKRQQAMDAAERHFPGLRVSTSLPQHRLEDPAILILHPPGVPEHDGRVVWTAGQPTLQCTPQTLNHDHTHKRLRRALPQASKTPH